MHAKLKSLDDSRGQALGEIENDLSTQLLNGMAMHACKRVSEYFFIPCVSFCQDSTLNEAHPCPVSTVVTCCIRTSIVYSSRGQDSRQAAADPRRDRDVDRQGDERSRDCISTRIRSDLGVHLHEQH